MAALKWFSLEVMPLLFSKKKELLNAPFYWRVAHYSYLRAKELAGVLPVLEA